MKWHISQLQKFQNKEFPFDEMINADEIKKLDSTIREVSPIRVSGRADINPTKVTFHLRIQGYLILPCSRTLVDVKYPIDVKTTETFLIKDYNYEGGNDEEVHQVTGDCIDLEPIIREILLLEIPMQVFCDDPSTEEGAPQSGKDWEVIQEQKEGEEKIDPRLQKLSKLLLNQNESSSPARNVGEVKKHLED